MEQKKHKRAPAHNNNIIFAPFAGSGTTLSVAQKLNRKAVDMDRDSNDCELAKKRMNNRSPAAT